MNSSLSFFVKAVQRHLLVQFLLFLPAVATVNAQGLGRGTMGTPVTEWPVAPPDSFSLNSEALSRHANVCQKTRASACLVSYKGYLVQEWYNPDYPGDPVQMQPWIGTRSATKSVAGLLAGILISDGKIEDVDTPVAEFIPEWEQGAEADVTLRHLLTMTSGVARHAGSGPRPGVVAVKNTSKFVLTLPLETEPGARWNYSNEGAQLLSPVLERAAGMPLAAFARERLFDPIGMSTTTMLVDEYYNTVTIGGMRTRIREFARIGQLMANEGLWNGEVIVAGNWIAESTTAIPQNEFYGYLWWIHPADNAYSAAGTFDQIIYVFADLDLVTVRLQRDVETGKTGIYWNGETRRLIREIVPQ